MRVWRVASGETWPDDELIDNEAHPPAQESRIVLWWDGAEVWLSRRGRGDLVAILFLLLLAGAITLKFSLRDTWLSRTDLLTQYIPWYAFLGEQLRNGILPGWSPFNASGLPFAGDPQSGWMYFPIMFWFSILPPVAAIKAVAATHILIAALGTYAFARLLGLRPVASLAGASGFAFGASVYHNTYCCTIWSQAFPWIPVGLLGVELGARSGPLRYRAGGWALAGIAISQMFAGWIGQGVYNGLLIIGAYTFYRTVISPHGRGGIARERITRLVVTGGAILLLGFGLAAAGALPRFEAARHSPISSAAYDVAEPDEGDSGWHYRYLFTQLSDNYSTSGRLIIQEVNRRYYIGGFVISLALVAPFMARRRYATPFFTSVAVVMLLLTLKETHLHRLFYLLPRFREIHEHAPFRVLGLFYFFPAILAAISIESLRDWVRKRWLFPALLVPVLIIFSIDAHIRNPVRWVAAPTKESALLVTVILFAAALTAVLETRLGARRVERRLTLLQILLLLGVLWDPVGRQLLRDDGTNDPMPPQVAASVAGALSKYDPGGAGEFLQAQLAQSPAPFRYFGYDGIQLRTAAVGDASTTYHGRVTNPAIQSLLVSGKAVPLRLYDIQSYNPAQYQPYVDYQLVMNHGVAQNYHDTNVLRTGLGSPLIDLLNVRYIVVPREVPPGRPDLLRLSQRYETVFTSDRVRVLENHLALPHAWIVHDAQITTRDDALALLDASAVDPWRVALIEEAIPGFAPTSAGGADLVVFDRYEPNRIDLTVQSGAGGLLVLNELDAPGWQAYLNGERVEIHRVNGLLRGVVVPAGASDLHLRYEPLTLRTGVAISGLTALVILAIAGSILIPLLPFGRRRAAGLRQPEAAISGAPIVQLD